MAIRRPDTHRRRVATSPAPRPARIDGAVRAILLVSIAGGLGWGIWRTLSGGSGGLVLGAAAAAATIVVWILVAAHGEPATSRLATWAVPGPLRLLIETGLIGLAAAAIWKGGSRAAAETLLTVAALHYALTWERVAWLLGRRRVQTVSEGDDPG